ncbi:MAG: hypothetical protein Q7K42_02030, partial [Candidatus Diapherotrites archaeon]|nr:hypothetical protein [Candidatus Diapherotrites archaeon]
MLKKLKAQIQTEISTRSKNRTTGFSKWHEKTDSNTRKRNANLIARYYVKARYWLKKKVPFKVDDNTVRIPSKGIEFETELGQITPVKSKSIELILENPYDARKKVLVVTKNEYLNGSERTVEFTVWDVSKKDKKELFHTYYSGSGKLADMSSFKIRNHQFKELFKGIGLGIFVDYLRLRD